jgi:hypothetical protein
LKDEVITDEGIRWVTTGNIGQEFIRNKVQDLSVKQLLSRIKLQLEVFPKDKVVSRLNEPIGN